MKKALRETFYARRAGLDEKVRQECDRRIRMNILQSPEFGKMGCIAIFATDGFEPDLLPLLEEGHGRIFALPRYNGKSGVYELAEVRNGSASLVPGKFGLSEPSPECPALSAEAVRNDTLHLVPGVAFDASGVRLGRGGGFYDRLLENVTSPVWGVYYSCQQSESALPRECHDRNLDGVFTENGVLDFRM